MRTGLAHEGPLDDSKPSLPKTSCESSLRRAKSFAKAEKARFVAFLMLSSGV